MYVHALQMHLGIPIIALRDGDCHCGSKDKRCKYDATGYHASICITHGQNHIITVSTL